MNVFPGCFSSRSVPNARLRSRVAPLSLRKLTHYLFFLSLCFVGVGMVTFGVRRQILG